MKTKGGAKRMTFFPEWHEMILALPEEERGDTYEAIVRMGLYDELPKGKTPAQKLVLRQVLTRMEGNKYLNSRVAFFKKRKKEREAQEGGKPE